jgi:membrane-bound ClpP family serine protease
MVQRIIGLVLVILFLFDYAPNGTSLYQRLWLPLIGGVGAYLVIHNVLAVALAVALVAGINSALGSSDPLYGVVYPLFAICAGIAAMVILARRFGAAIRDTRTARRTRRNQRTAQDPD